MIRTTALFLLALCFVASPHGAKAATTEYALNVPPSALEAGCFGPCACAVTEQPTYGSFQLVPLGSDALYTYYAVERYIASFNNGPGAVSIVGSGQYKIGGEFAITQQMTLDLQVWGGPVQHFDSGVVPVNTPFSKIHVSCAVHGFACHDSVVVVDASPIQTTGVPPSPAVAAIEPVRPNPFGHAARITVDLDRAGAVELDVFDLAGHHVRALAAWQSPGASTRTLEWDGRRDDGREAGPGVYWLTMRSPAGVAGRRVVKLD